MHTRNLKWSFIYLILFTFSCSPGQKNSAHTENDSLDETPINQVEKDVDLDRDTIKCMTYNIRMDSEGDKGDNWHHRKAEMVNYIEKNAPDFLGIQEGLAHQVLYLDSFLVDYTYIGVGRDDGQTNGEFMAIYYQQQKWRLKKDSTIWLSATPEKPSIGWDAQCYRTGTFGRFENDQGQKVQILNTHFDHKGTEARENSIGVLQSFLESKGTSTIVMGDFNFEPSDQNYSSLLETLSDAQSIALNKNAKSIGTFNGFKTEGPFPRKIDYIFVDSKKWNVVMHEVDEPKTKLNRQLSDHFPVSVKLVAK